MSNKFTSTLDEIINKIEELIREGNLRRIIIRDQDGKIFIEIPLLIGAIGSLAAPYVTAIGAIAGFAAKFTIEIIKNDEKDSVEFYEIKNDKS